MTHSHSDAKKFAFFSSFKNNKTFLNQLPITDLFKDHPGNVFVSSDKFVFDVNELAQFIEKKGSFVNPHTNQLFSIEDKNRLITRHKELSILDVKWNQANELKEVSQETLDRLHLTSQKIGIMANVIYKNDITFNQELATVAKELGYLDVKTDISTIRSVENLSKNLKENLEEVRTTYKTRLLFQLYDYLLNHPLELKAINNLITLKELYETMGVQNLDDYFAKLKSGNESCLNGAAGLLNLIKENIIEKIQITPSKTK